MFNVPILYNADAKSKVLIDTNHMQRFVLAILTLYNTHSLLPTAEVKRHPPQHDRRAPNDLTPSQSLSSPSTS